MFRLFQWRSNRYRYRRVDDLPDTIRAKTIYIVGRTTEWLLAFKCPCGCDATIQLNLLEEETPNWSYAIWRRRISVYPSIRRTKGCKSHFWIYGGSVDFVRRGKLHKGKIGKAL